MNFNSGQNNSNKETNVNTNGIVWRNKDGFKSTAIQIGYWNETIALKIHPALDPDKQTEKKWVDWEKFVNTAITLQKMQELHDIIVNDILPGIEKGENVTKGVTIGNDSMVLISTGYKLTNEIRPYIGILKGINETTKKPEIALNYEFTRSVIVDDYDEATGEFKIKKNVHSQLLLFKNILSAAIGPLTKSTAHSSRVVDKYYRDRVLNTVNATAEKVGAQASTYGGGYGNKKNIFASAGNQDDSAAPFNGSGGEEIPVENLENINDITNFLS